MLRQKESGINKSKKVSFDFGYFKEIYPEFIVHEKLREENKRYIYILDWMAKNCDMIQIVLEQIKGDYKVDFRHEF